MKNVKSEIKEKIWVHEINLTRNANGEFSTLFEYLLHDESKFKQYFRMSIVKFQQLFQLMEPHLTKQLIIEIIVKIVKFHLQYITKVT